MNHMRIQPWLKEKKKKWSRRDKSLGLETVDMKRNIKRSPTGIFTTCYLPLFNKGISFFLHRVQHTQDTARKAFRIKVSSPSVRRPGPFSKPTRIWACRFRQGWPAGIPRLGCWSLEGTAQPRLPHSPSEAQGRNRCQSRSGGYRDTVSLPGCSAARPGMTVKTVTLSDRHAKEGTHVRHKHRHTDLEKKVWWLRLRWC